MTPVAVYATHVHIGPFILWCLFILVGLAMVFTTHWTMGHDAAA